MSWSDLIGLAVIILLYWYISARILPRLGVPT
jgi:hypothetical protein